MSTTSIIVAINLIFAVIAISEFRRRPSRGVRPSNTARRSQFGLDAHVRVAEFAATTIRPQSLVTARVAPLDEPGTVLEILPAAGGPLCRIGVHDVLDVRLWLRGRPVALRAEGIGSRAGSALRPLSPELAGWELELTTQAGETVRCYGTSLTPAAEQDLLRLRRMVALPARSASTERAALMRRAGASVRFGDLSRRPAALGRI